MLKTEKDKEEMKHDDALREVLEKHAKELQDLGLLWTPLCLQYTETSFETE